MIWLDNPAPPKRLRALHLACSERMPEMILEKHVNSKKKLLPTVGPWGQEFERAFNETKAVAQAENQTFLE
tara:strand:- start:27 stop:239 length:213 start_codon:yes stop_codon:yes gene_type:complete